MTLSKILAISALALVLAACSGGPRKIGYVSMYVPDTAIVPAQKNEPMTIPNNKAGAALASQMTDRVNPASPIRVGRFVSLESQSQGAPLGKILALQISGSLAANGYTVVLGNKVPVRTEVENATVLTPAETTPGYALHGTFAPTGRAVLISASVLRISDSAVMAAHDWVLPMNSETMALLGQDTGQSSTAPVTSTMINGQDSVPMDQPPMWPMPANLYK